MIGTSVMTQLNPKCTSAIKPCRQVTDSRIDSNSFFLIWAKLMICQKFYKKYLFIVFFYSLFFIFLLFRSLLIFISFYIYWVKFTSNWQKGLGEIEESQNLEKKNGNRNEIQKERSLIATCPQKTEMVILNQNNIIWIIK